MDISKVGDALKLLDLPEIVEKGRETVERATRQLEQAGLEIEPETPGADRVKALAEGPVMADDGMAMQADRFAPATWALLERNGLTAEAALSHPDLAEKFAGHVFELEGIPDGNGGTEAVRGVAGGHFDAQHGLDLVATDSDGRPIPIEVKKYGQPSAAHLDDANIVGLEPAVEAWRVEREKTVWAARQGRLSDIRSDAHDRLKPEVDQWRRSIEHNAGRVRKDGQGRDVLPVEQMDDLWVRDRWLKLIKTIDGQDRMRQIGVDARFLDYRRLAGSPDLPEWQAMLDGRTVVIVSARDGATGKRLFDQAIFQNQAKRVVQIKV